MNRFVAVHRPLGAVVIVLAAAVAASAAEWGSVKGRIVLDGPAPEKSPLQLGNDPFCIGLKPVDETFVIGEKGALANVAIFIVVPRTEKIDVHPDYAELAKKPSVLNNKNCRFEPRIALLRTGQPFVIKNSDATGHSTNVTDNFNAVIGVGEESTKSLTRPMPTPIPVTCNLHPFMNGFVLFLEHPYMAATNEKGEFEIKNIPAGARGFTFWHESPGYIRDVKVGSGTTDRRGKVDLTIKPNETLDVGEIRIPVAAIRSR